MPATNAARLLNRFLEYVAIDTTADETSPHYPSSPGQLRLGQVLAEQLREMGARDVRHDEHGLVWAAIPGNARRETPAVALNAHLDTSPEASGAGVRPQVIRGYRGGDIPLPKPPGSVILAAENPELQPLLGCTLVTSDGATLLGGDDKAGVAVIMEMAACLLEHPDTPHGPLRILFTCDEEIGRGVDHVDLRQLDAAVCYTLDGKASNEIDQETFSADLAALTFRGLNIHPSIAKNRMVNAVKAAAQFLVRLPHDRLSPETTEGRAGFLHPYHIAGGVALARVNILLRDFQTDQLEHQAALIRQLARQLQAETPGLTIEVDVSPQYRNMAAGLAQQPRAVRYAQLAHQRLGRTAKLTSIRGGTDGTQLTAKGLPTPNLSTGQHNPHSEREWVCLEEMCQATEVLIELLQVWTEQPPLEDDANQ